MHNRVLMKPLRLSINYKKYHGDRGYLKKKKIIIAGGKIGIPFMYTIGYQGEKKVINII